MRTFAPGKVVLTGAYAVLEGAPAIVAAVNRGVVADSSRVAADPTPEVVCARLSCAPYVDASALFVGSRKLGLGASAAILVASIAAAEGFDPSDTELRNKIFSRAWAAHREAQGGGSGVDIAASVHGGVIQYVMNDPPKRVELPQVYVEVFASQMSARTSDLRAAVDRLAKTDAVVHRACMDDLVIIAKDAAEAVSEKNAPAFVDAVRRSARALDRLGIAAGVEIVPAGWSDLEKLSKGTDGAFVVSGAGGGDVSIYVGERPPSSAFVERARVLGLFPLDLSFAYEGVKIQ